MTQTEYAANNGSRCPSCRSENIDSTDRLRDCIRTDVRMATRSMCCQSCKFCWTETYNISGYHPH
jgi:hypothetical protein